MHERVSSRGAGVLLHITSLSSNFGLGDLGPAAYRFVDFLKESLQKYWQILPVTPTEANCAYSPYSSYSSMAGNTLLISPELLLEDELLDASDLTAFYLPVNNIADFETGANIRQVLFEIAFEQFKTTDNETLKNDFAIFCNKEHFWLRDFALYEVLRKEHNGYSWIHWADSYKHRIPEMLTDFEKQHSDQLLKIKFLQFIFFRQWAQLKSYCCKSGIEILGDMPFYVSHNSVDVWTHPELFALDERLEMGAEAGVPPDYFNSEGQMWRMPIFRWEVLRSTHYEWWIQRIRKNMELFDLLRFDHFRAFSAYWEIPANDTTAKNGVWKTGPGADFFKEVEKQLGKLPFIAEDLGDIDQAVYELRDGFGFPGMRVLHFAFGYDMPHSVAIPHLYAENSVVYSGTHDNNTTVGWFQHDATEIERSNLASYTGQHVRIDNVHHLLARLAYSSIAKIAILPMQDVLGLGAASRMNTPATETGNWRWRLKTEQLGITELNLLSYFVETFGRW